MVHYHVFVKKDIQIDIAGAFIDDLLSPHGLFYILQYIEKSNWLQGCLHLHNAALESERRTFVDSLLIYARYAKDGRCL
jgi:hypothetical protein